MEQLEQATRPASGAPPVVRAGCAAAGAVVLATSAGVIGLRLANGGVEPEGQNWWLVACLAVGLSFAVVGAALSSSSTRTPTPKHTRRRPLGAAFVVIGLGAALAALSTQYDGYLATRVEDRGWTWLAEARHWSWAAAGGLLVGVVPWMLPPERTSRDRRGATVAVTVTLVVLAAAIGEAQHWPASSHDVLSWIVVLSATVGTARLGVLCWRGRSRPDPLPAWVLAGVVAAGLAVVPDRLGLGPWTLAGRDVVTALLLLATVPLLAGGVAIAAIRDRASTLFGISSRTLEWFVLSAGIVGVYTAAVAGLGRLVGGSGPTWFLVAATGALAVALEPARRRIGRLVDRLVYGARDEPLAVVQRIVDHLGADAGDALLPALVSSLRDELRLDAVTIDLRVDDGWRPGASTGPPTAQRRVVPLRHRGELVGRLVVGWSDGPALRDRDADILDQLVGPLSLAVGWVRLAEELRRSSVAIVSAREEERRRLRRDLHDGLGPSLTGVSLGVRTAVRQLERRAGADPGPAPRQLLERVADEVDGAVVDLKRIVRDLRPTALDQFGLAGAVAEFTRGLGDALDITLALPSEHVQLPAAVEIATYRIVTEAVTNVVRHAQATHCWLTIATGATVVIDVVDDGVGIAPRVDHGVGLAAMRERAGELGGSVRVLAHAPRGTHVHVRLPAALS